MKNRGAVRRSTGLAPLWSAAMIAIGILLTSTTLQAQSADANWLKTGAQLSTANRADDGMLTARQITVRAQ